MKQGYMTEDGKFFTELASAQRHEHMLNVGLALYTSDCIHIPNNAPGKSLAKYALALTPEAVHAFCEMFECSLDSDWRGILVKDFKDEWNVLVDDLDADTLFHLLNKYLHMRDTVDKLEI